MTISFGTVTAKLGTVTAQLLKNMSVLGMLAALTLAPFPRCAFADAAQDCTSPIVTNAPDTIIRPPKVKIAVEDNKRPTFSQMPSARNGCPALRCPDACGYRSRKTQGISSETDNRHGSA
jgi:hypothetical protein